jgi:hypothetical protein
MKNISDHSNRSLRDIFEGVGVSFAAIGKDSIRGLQAGSIQERVCLIILIKPTVETNSNVVLMFS